MMLPTRGALGALLLALQRLAPTCQAASFLRAGQVSQKDADSALDAEFAELHQAGRVAVFEDSLRATYAALPKNEHGQLGHQAVRYVLHRLFVQRHGWYVKGLDPASDSAGNTTTKEWVPSYLQTRLEARTGERGANLRELAVLAAALEDLVRKEAIGRLGTAYEILELPPDSVLSKEQTEDLMKSYFISFLIAHNLSAQSPVEMHKKQAIFARKYKGWEEAHDWLLKSIVRENDTAPEGFDMAATSQMAINIGDRYHAFNDLECKSLKTTLLEIEDRRAGRVHLSAFYNKSMHSHWRFTEKADYLRAIGALDETNASKPLVIVPNYVTGRMNCLESSSIYALCCRNECEDLMGRLEREIGSPEASPAKIASLVETLPSDTVEAPRMLPESLKSRLVQVSEGSGGVVPLHSRLFAQWMHHAYPRECPYPHEFGTTSPQTPDEWTQETGQESSSASDEEMKEQVDNCPADHGDEGSADLPWSEVQEHFAASASSAADEDARGSWSVPLLMSAALAASVAGCWRGAGGAGQGPRQGGRGLLDGDSQAGGHASPLGVRCCVLLALLTAASWLHAAGLLDASTAALAAAVGAVGLAARALSAQQGLTAHKAKLRCSL